MISDEGIKKIIHCCAWRFYPFIQDKDISYEDLINECWLCILRARKLWKSDGEASINTYLTHCVKRHFMSISNIENQIIDYILDH